MSPLDYSKQYLAAGFSVIPLQVDGTKQPVGSWKPYCERHPTEYELAEWFGPCGIGLVCGSISQNLLVIDFDHNAEELFTRFWDDITEQLPGVEHSLVVTDTPRPGKQVWLRTQTPPGGSTVLAWTAPTDAKQHPSLTIETRGQNAYIVAPGGPASVHPTGRPYQFSWGNPDALQPLPDEVVARLLDICRSYTEWQPQHVQPKPAYTGEPRPGDVFNANTDLRQLLLELGWTVHHTDDDGTEFLIRPGKDTPGFSASLGYLKTEDGRPLLYVFSANAAPFEELNAYDAFAVFALTKHGGDFGKAAAVARILFADELTAKQQQWHAQVAEQIPDAQPYKPLPSELLPEVAGRYVCEAAAAIGVDTAFVGLPLLSVLAAAIGPARGVYLKRNFTQPAILWTASIGEPSTGKSPGWEAGTAAAGAIEQGLHTAAAAAEDAYQAAMRGYRQALSDGEATTDDAPEKPDPVGQFLVADATLESLVDVHKANPKLLLSCDELAGWLKRMDQYRPGADAEAWLSIFSGGSISVNRKTNGYRVWLPRTSISVCGTIQPAVAREYLFSPRFIGNGFAARILTAAPPSGIVRWSDREVDEDTENELFKLVQSLYLLTGEPHGNSERPLVLPCTPEARQAFIAWTNDAADHAETLAPEIRSSWLKLRPTAARFALVFSVCRQLSTAAGGQATQPIDLASMRAGIQLARWFGEELQRNAHCDEHTALRQHLQWIHRNHADGVDVRTLVAGRRSITTAADARRVMQQLVNLETGTLDDAGRFIPTPL